MAIIGTISANGMHFWGRHGCCAVENQWGQKYILDVSVTYDMERICKDDTLSSGVSYGDIYTLVREMFTTTHYKLIQPLAHDIANAIRRKFPFIQCASVTIHKLFVSFGGIVDRVGVTVSDDEAPERKHQLNVTGMRLWGHCGFAQEQEIGEEYRVDVSACYDMQPMFDTDDIKSGLSITSVYEATRKIVQNRRFVTIQALANEIADAVTAVYAPINSLQVTVKKPNVQIESILDCLSVTIAR
jgi:dihydroneopterin aldolase